MGGHLPFFLDQEQDTGRTSPQAELAHPLHPCPNQRWLHFVRRRMKCAKPGQRHCKQSRENLLASTLGHNI